MRTLLVAGVLAALTAQPSATSASAVQRIERVFVDTSRTTPPNGSFPGADERTLRTLIWLPEDATAPAPLLLMAHGFGGLPEKFDALARFIAARGYVVAALTFPLSNQHAPGGTALVDLDQQPGDVAFVLAELRAAAASGDAELGGRIDTAAVALLGHSLGGVTAQTVAFTPCCGDTQLRAAILVGTVSIVSAAPPAQGPATLIVHGTDDPLIPFHNAFGLLAALVQADHLLGVQQGSHAVLLESQVEPPIPARDATQRTIAAFLDAVLRDQPASLDTLLSELYAAGHVTVRPACPGDCNGDGVVFIDELLTGVEIAIADGPFTACTAFDRDRNQSVTVDELLAAVGAALGRCVVPTADGGRPATR